MPTNKPGDSSTRGDGNTWKMIPLEADQDSEAVGGADRGMEIFCECRQMLHNTILQLHLHLPNNQSITERCRFLIVIGVH